MEHKCCVDQGSGDRYEPLTGPRTVPPIPDAIKIKVKDSFKTFFIFDFLQIQFHVSFYWFSRQVCTLMRRRFEPSMCTLALTILGDFL